MIDPRESVTPTVGLLILIALLLWMIFWRLGDIEKRLREHFPTEKEQKEVARMKAAAEKDKEEN